MGEPEPDTVQGSRMGRDKNMIIVEKEYRRVNFLDKKIRKYGVRKFAEKINISPSLLSMILNEKTPIPLKRLVSLFKEVKKL
jgi:hypothetical protein